MRGHLRARLLFAFLLMGFSFTIVQGLMIRELLVSFFGNELSIGLILGNWLVLEALGSGLIGRLATRHRAGPASYALLQILLAVMLPLSLYGAFAVRRILGLPAGQGAGLDGIFCSSLLVLTPLGLVDGAMFAFGARAFAQLMGRDVPGIGQVYVCEAAGGIVGGLIFTYVLVPHLATLQMALLLAVLNLLSALSLLPVRSHSFPLATLLLIVIAAVLLSPLEARVRRRLVGQQWGTYNLVGYENSIYGNVAVIRQAGQYTFFANGLPVLTAPVPDVQGIEELVHIPLLYHSHPRKVLVVSGGVGGVLHELLKYPVERIDYAELDPLLIQMAQRFPTDLTQAELSDPRVHIHAVDGRLLVRQLASGDPSATSSGGSWKGGEGYDAIIVNLPYPSTLQLNRFYTVEFFRMVEGILAPEGILVLRSPGSATHMGPEMRELNALLDRTLRIVFPAIAVVPGDTHLWIASPSPHITALSSEELVARWEQRRLPTQMVSDFHIRLKLDERRATWFWDALAGSSGHGINSDLHPVGLARGLAYWNALFSASLAGPLSFLSQLSLRGLLLPGALLLGLLLLLGWPGRRRLAIPIAIATTGVSGMACDIIVIFAFQTLYGYVYQQVGLLTTAFMAGLALGGLLITWKVEHLRREWRWLAGMELAIVLYWTGLALLLGSIFSRPASILLQPTLLLLNGLAGFLVGSEFPLANRILSQLRGGLKGASGLLYACDLAGAFVGSVLVSVVLIPTLGIIETCVLVGGLKLVGLVGAVRGAAGIDEMGA